jgi:HD superfamily phosphohydrolase
MPKAELYKSKSKIRALFETSHYSWLFDEVEVFAEEMLSKYTSIAEENISSYANKEIYDAIWGSIPFSAEEILILDSPLIQRLRRIRQLGMSDCVYLGSLYSRYYHTIGVVSVADNMTRVINSRIEALEHSGRVITSAKSREEKELFLCIARLAAIFHDTGHFFYSHATEKYFQDDISCIHRKSIDDMMDNLEENFSDINIALHELISCMIVNTNAVRNLLTIYYDSYKEKINPSFSLEKCIEYISSLIIGVPTDQKILPYSKIINGPVDADKCDYLSRDSYVTKIPVGVDISRLIYKLTVLVKDDVNKSAIWNDDNPQKTYLESAVSESAERTIFQLCMAKNTMYGSVYYHQKVLTAETTFREILREIFNLFPDEHRNFSKILTLTDDYFGQYLLFYLEEKKKCETGNVRKKRISLLIDDIQDLISRKLCKRFADISYDNLIGAQSSVIPFNNLTTKPENSDELSQFLDEVRNEYIEIQKLLEVNIEAQDVKLFVIAQDSISEDPAKIKVAIDLGNGKSRPFRKYAPIVSKEAGDRKIYLVTNQFDRDILFIALETSLFRKNNICLNEESSSCAKYRENEIYQRKKLLFGLGYYSKQLSNLIPDEILIEEMDHGKKMIEELAAKFAQFDGPGNKRISEKTILAFLKQFCGIPVIEPSQYKEVLSAILDLLADSIFINRSEFLNSMKPLLEDVINVAPGSCYIHALGGDGDSSHHLNYYMKNDLIEFLDQKGLSVISVPDLEEWLETQAQCKDTLIFFDDGAYSGKQAFSIFQTYFGIDAKDRATSDKDHVRELSDAAKEKMRELSIMLLYVCAAKHSTEGLQKMLSNEPLNLKITDIRSWHDISTKLVNENPGGKVPKAIERVMSHIGTALLRNKKPHWDEKRISSSALGYNDSQQMVFTTWSVPTYTITAFWLKGNIEDDWEWEPLFERTPK